MGCQARRVAEWQGCGYHRDTSLRLQMSIIFNLKDSTYLFYCQYVLSGMEASTDTFDYKSWARNIPSYEKTLRIPSPAPLQMSSPASQSQGTRPVKQEASTSSEEPQETKWWRLSAIRESFTALFSRSAFSKPEESQQRKWHGLSAVQEFFTSFYPRSASSPLRAKSQQRKWQRLSAFRESFASFFLQPTVERKLFLFALIFLLVAAIVYRSVTQSHPKATEPRPPEADCLRILSSASYLESFPLPYEVDLQAHEVILNVNNIPNLEILTLLNHTHSAVCSTLVTTAQGLVGYIFNASGIYLPLPRRYTTDSFYNDTLSISQQLRIAASQVNSLTEEYDTLQKAYDTLMEEMNGSSKEDGLGLMARFLVYAQPGGPVQRLGFFDAHTFLTPAEAKAAVMGKAISGVFALTREQERVGKIKRVVGEVDRALKLLAGAVRDIRTKSLETKSGRKLIQRRVKEWYKQHIIQNGQLKEDWIELLASVDIIEKEGRALKLSMTRDWCDPNSNSRHKRITVA